MSLNKRNIGKFVVINEKIKGFNKTGTRKIPTGHHEICKKSPLTSYIFHTYIQNKF